MIQRRMGARFEAKQAGLPQLVVVELDVEEAALRELRVATRDGRAGR